jgi:hypothetical protein
VVCKKTLTAKEQDAWDEECQFWGLAKADNEPELIPLMDENLAAVEWWMSIPSFLRWNNGVCLGMDVVSVQADLALSDRESEPENYQKLKLIARVITEELNQRE